MRILYSFVLIILVSVSARAQDFGLSFSYFIPKNGYFSTPISPFSIRGVGISLTNFLALETGASLYRMSGLNVKDLPFETKDPLVGPNFTIFIPAELVLELKGGNVQFDIKGGGFFFYGFDQKINYGNMDRVMRDHYSQDVLNANLSYENKPGFGYHAGAELTVYVTNQVGVSIECNYLVGQSGFPLTGSYTAGTGNTITTVDVAYPDSKIDLTGLEFSIGLIFSSGGGKPAPPKRRRR
ncbi:MAG: hypothetical protein QY309_10715 [Cyclobacteriaceae bacterium]|nr:MAG: hypothetical protein QY309_10715 [Cyclobacteriaceae bacterium]